MLLLLISRLTANRVGCVSVFLSCAFWTCVFIPVRGPESYWGPVLVTLGIVALCGAFVAGIVAPLRGSRWWLVALFGPLSGLMFLLSLH